MHNFLVFFNFFKNISYFLKSYREIVKLIHTKYSLPAICNRLIYSLKLLMNFFYTKKITEKNTHDYKNIVHFVRSLCLKTKK